MGDGSSMLFLRDPWLGGGPLNVKFRRLFIYMNKNSDAWLQRCIPYNWGVDGEA